MALTAASAGGNFPVAVAGNRRRWIGDITFDNSYPTNGYPVTSAIANALFGLNAVDSIIVSGCTLVGRNCTWVTSTGKLKLYVSSTAVEVGSGVDVSADKVGVIVYGT